MFTWGEIQWLSLELAGVKPLAMVALSHAHRHNTTVGDGEACPANVTRIFKTIGACTSYRGAHNQETTSHLGWESVVQK